MKISRWMKPGWCFAGAAAAVCCALTAVDIKRMLNRQEYTGNLSLLCVALWIISILGAAYVILYAVNAFLSRKGLPAVRREEKKGEWIIYLCAAVLITLGLFINYRNVNLSYPIVFTSGDEIGAYAQVKSIIQNGTTLITPLEGGAAGADMFDYLYSDKLSFLIVKSIGNFVKNPYTAAALFFFLNHYLIALISVWVCRKMKISRPMAVAAGVLYAFSPYIQQRFCHLWLTPYFMLPVACLIAVWIIEGKAFEEDAPLRRNKTFWRMAGMCFACAFTGLYYAFFTCAMLAAATVIRFFREKERKFSRIFYPTLLIGAVGAGVLANAVPNLVYWYLNGANPSSELAMRSSADAEIYALKLTRLLLPRTFHRVGKLWHISERYLQSYPLSNENQTAALGVIAAVGFAMSIIMLLAGRKKYLTVTSLNMSAFLIGTVGGLGGFISVFINIPMRCYNRISLVIMFLSLVMCAMLLEEVVKKRRTLTLTILAAVLVCVGFFDQTIPAGNQNADSYEEIRDEVRAAEAQLEPGDSVFTLPYDSWPSATIPGSYILHEGYIESDTLYWSYGAMEGREQAVRQAEAADKEPYEMIQDLREAGYDGIWLDTVLMSQKYGEEYAAALKEDISAILEDEPEVSRYGRICFWKIPEKTENQ